MSVKSNFKMHTHVFCILIDLSEFFLKKAVFEKNRLSYIKGPKNCSLKKFKRLFLLSKQNRISKQSFANCSYKLENKNIHKNIF